MKKPPLGRFRDGSSLSTRDHQKGHNKGAPVWLMPRYRGGADLSPRPLFARYRLTLQLPFFEVSALSGSLVGSAPE